MTSPTPRAVVIGAGLAGLAAARALAGRYGVTCLEASGRVGGMVCPVTLGGVRVDAGAEAFATRGGRVEALARELGLDVIEPGGHATVWWPDGSYALADGLLGIPASTDDPALEALGTDERARYLDDLTLPAEVGADATTVAELVAARMGDAAVARLVVPLAHSIYKADPREMTLAQYAPRLLAALAEHGTLTGAVASLRPPSEPMIKQTVGGMFRLVEALEADVRGRGVDLRLRCPATALRAGDDGRAVVVTDDGELPADRVILATSADAAAGLLADLGVRAELPSMHSANLAMLAISHPGLADGPVGSGLLVGERDERLVANSMTHYSHKWPWASVPASDGTPGVEIVRLSYPDGVEITHERALADAALFCRLDLTDDDVTGFVAGSWHGMPGPIDPAARARTLDAAAAVGVDIVGTWVDGSGMASVLEGVERLGADA